MHPRTREIVGKSSRVGARQWLSLVAVIWLQSVNGTNSNFPAYSSQLKQAMSISQLQLNNLAFANDAGKLFGWVSGIAALYLPLWSVLLIGAVLGLVSYGVQYFFLSGHLPANELSYPVMFFLTVLAGNSICWINTVCYAVIITNFSSGCRQMAVGLSTSYQGLSANIYTDIINVVASTPKSKRANTYLLLNSILPTTVSVVTSFLVRGDKVGLCLEDGDEGSVSRLFVVLFVITIATGLYAVVSSLGENLVSINPKYNVIGMGLLLIVPLIIPLIDSTRRTRIGRWWAKQIHDLSISETEDGNFHHAERAYCGSDIVRQAGGQVQMQRMQQCNHEFARESRDFEVVLESGHSERHEKIDVGLIREEIGVKLMLRRIDFWLYFFTYLCGVTLGLVYLNNLGQITESRGSSNTSTIVSLSSAFSFFGRIFPSILDYILYRQKHIVSRQACVAALMVPMAGSFFLLLNSRDVFLYISTAIISLCTGAITSISVSITTELFGTKNFSVNHNVVVGNIPIGSFLFGYIAAIMYRRKGNAEGKCIGSDCYHNNFIIWGSLCFLGTNLALLLYVRSRRFY